MKSINSKLPQSRRNFKKNENGSYIMVEKTDTEIITDGKAQKEFRLLPEETKARTQNLSNELRAINQFCL